MEMLIYCRALVLNIHEWKILGDVYLLSAELICKY